MKKFFCIFTLVTILAQLFFLPSCAKKDKFSAYSFDYFDTVTSIVGYETSKEAFDETKQLIMSELEDFHRLFTIYDRYEGINNLCVVNSVSDGKHQAVEVDQKIIELLKYSKEMYQKTGGKVNVAMGSVLSIWHEHREQGINDPANATLPDHQELIEASLHTDINNVIIDETNSTVFLSDPDMLLDVGAIAKGYAVEMIAQMLQEKEVSGYIINVGGNVRTIGTRKNGEKWIVGIENPESTKDNAYLNKLALADLSLVTSGSYQRYYVVDGKNYNHIIDPDTLAPSEKYMSVSVVTKSSALADALSTALFSLSFEKGLEMIEELEGVEAMWFFPDGDIKYSSGFSNYITDN